MNAIKKYYKRFQYKKYGITKFKINSMTLLKKIMSMD